MENKKFPTVTKTYLLIFMLLAWIVQTVAAFGPSGGFAINGSNLTQTQSILIPVAMFVPAVTLLVFCAIKMIPLSSLGLRPIKPLWCLIAAGAVVLMLGVTFLARFWFCDFPSFFAVDGKWGINGLPFTFFPYPNPPVAFVLNTSLTMLAVMALTVPAALGEELAWRGYSQKIFTDKFGMTRGIIFLGIIWGLFHVPVNLAGYNFGYAPAWMGAFLLMPLSCVAIGFIFGWFRVKSDSVWPAAVAHSTNNTLSLLMGLAVPKANTAFVAGIGIGVLVIFGMICLVSLRKVGDSKTESLHIAADRI